MGRSSGSIRSSVRAGSSNTSSDASQTEVINGLDGVELDGFDPALDLRFKQLSTAQIEAGQRGVSRDMITGQSYCLVMPSSRAQVFTVSPIAVMICDRGGPMAPTIASPQWMPIPIRNGCGKSP